MNMTASEIITSIVSILSLFVAIVSWCISHYVNKRMLSIEERREQDRLKEANTGKISVVMTKADSQFIIRNDGSVDVVVTDILVNGIKLQEHPWFSDFKRDLIVLPSGKNFFSITFIATRIDDSRYRPPFDVLVKWETANGEFQQQEMTVNWI